MSWLIVYGKFLGKYYLAILSTFFCPQKQQQQPPNFPHLNAGRFLEVIRILDLPDPKRDFGFLALPKLSTRATSQKGAGHPEKGRPYDIMIRACD